MAARFYDMRAEQVERYQEFSRKLGPRELWSVALQASLYVDEYAIARSVAIADLLRTTLDVPGNVAEFGTWQGANLLYMAKLLRIYDPHSPKRVHCFDSFEGLQTFGPEDGPATAFRSTYRGSYEHLLSAIAFGELEREIVVHKGEISEVLPRVLQEQPGLRFSFVYCDVDLYAPTAVVLRTAHERLTCGGLFVLDEYGWDEFPGETLAVHEFLEEWGADYEVRYLRETRQPTLALRKMVR